VYWVFSPSLLLQVVVSPGQVGVLHLLPLHGPQEHARLARLLGQPVVDVGDDRERGAGRVAEAHADPVIPGTKEPNKKNSLSTQLIQKNISECISCIQNVLLLK